MIPQEHLWMRQYVRSPRLSRYSSALTSDARTLFSFSARLRSLFEEGSSGFCLPGGLALLHGATELAEETRRAAVLENHQGQLVQR